MSENHIIGENYRADNTPSWVDAIVTLQTTKREWSNMSLEIGEERPYSSMSLAIGEEWPISSPVELSSTGVITFK